MYSSYQIHQTNLETYQLSPLDSNKEEIIIDFLQPKKTGLGNPDHSFQL